jgi:hypothetical protein
MALYNYLIPTVIPLPVGYDATVFAAAAEISARLEGGTGLVLRTATAYYEGKIEEELIADVEFRDGQLVNGTLEPMRWPGAGGPPRTHPGYVETSYRMADGVPRFTVNTPPTPYSVFNAPRRKSFFSDNARKYSHPAIIGQIAKYGRYVDGYPVPHIDRDRDYGESLVLINPYRKAVLAKIQTADGRTIPRLRVPPMSVRRVDLAQLLEEYEQRWRGRLQLTANNRLITFDVKHSFADPTIITDHEHLDPFRADPTHAPLTRLMRMRVGGALSRGRAALRRAGL